MEISGPKIANSEDLLLVITVLKHGGLVGVLVLFGGFGATVSQ